MESIDDFLEQSEEGVWLIKGQSAWSLEDRRLDHDVMLLPKILPYIEPGTIAIDVGAFIGDHTISYLRAVGPDGLCVAYEPNPIAFECLRRNCPHSVHFQCAVGNKVGKTFLTTLTNNEGASFTSLQGTLEVNATTLDYDFSHILYPIGWNPVSFIKIDVEGTEIEVLCGAKKLITQYQPVLLIEVKKGSMERSGHTNLELMRFMSEHGYQTEILPVGLTTWDSDIAEVLCVHG